LLRRGDRGVVLDRQRGGCLKTQWKGAIMQTVSLEEAQSRLAEILDTLPPGEEVLITRGDEPVATIRAVPAAPREGPRFGTLKGTVLHMAPDFDAIPEGFEDYVP
jgi:antitoxin (DNA-binding transcriptional repressor) of toxin-antitoxin stability system